VIISVLVSGEANTNAAEDELSDLRADLNRIKQRILEPLLQPVPLETTRGLMASLRPDGSWPDIDYEDRTRSGWKTPTHLSRVNVLTRAYKSPGSELCGNQTLRQSVHSSLDYWLDHDFQNSNWWWNRIGVPKSLHPVLLLLEDELAEEQRDKGLKILSRAKIGMTGQNLVWVTEIVAVRAILEKDPELAATAYRRIVGEIRIATGEGIQPDFSFHQHGPCLYSHGYGAAFVADCSRIAAQVSGTRLAFPPEKVAVLSSLILDGSQWMARGGASDFGAEGREISRPGQNVRYLGTAAQNMLAVTTDRSQEFQQLAARAAGEEASPLVGNRHFWRSDMMVHHRPGYYTSARMFSRRIANTDQPCNSEGLKSHHIADGCNLVMRTGQEYDDIFPVWDWQKIPGTTVEQRPQLDGSPRRQGERMFVGGVSDGTYGLAAFDFSRDDLAARKSWFFFDDAYVCLGAGITCPTENSVVTTLNQCHLVGDVAVCEGGAIRRLARGSHDPERPAWVWHDQIAYFFLHPAQISLRNTTQQGSWQQIALRYSDSPISRDVFTLWIDHGTRPQDATYAYCVVPGTSLPEDTHLSPSAVTILANSPQLQAVRHENLNIAAMAFYETGSVNIRQDLTVGVSTPCLVLVREMPENMTISVSNPTNEEAAVIVEVTKRLQGEGVETAEGQIGSRITFNLPNGIYAGRSVTRSWKTE